MKRFLLGLLFLSACKTTTLQSGVDLAHFDSEVRAQDDFYHHVNGKWLKTFEIPADKSNYGSFTKLADEAEVNIKAIVQAANPGTKVGDFFAAFMDTKAVEAAGLEPLREEFVRVFDIKTKSDLVRTWGRFLRMGIRSPLYFYVNQDLKKSTEYIGYLHQSGLGLPDRDYYSKEGERFTTYRKAYRNYVDQLLEMTSTGKRPEATESILMLESGLAEQHWTRVQNRDRDKTYNKFSLEELNAHAPNIDWKAYFEGASIPVQSHVIVRQPTFLKTLSEQVMATDLDEWRVYLAFCLFDSMAPLLSDNFVDAHFNMRLKTLRGIKENRPRWKRAISALNGALGEELGKEYVARHFKPEAKARMKDLVKNLEAAFSAGIDGLEWMTDATKVEAKKKLESFISKIGYPDVWKDYTKLQVKADDIVGNAFRSSAFDFDRSINKLGGPIDRNEWFMTPQTVNAYYNPPMNEIVFPAAILQPPFFNLEADDAVNYGGIGAVIGHELSHGFDDQGRKSDGDGNLRDWWTEKDATEFKARADKMVVQYGKFEPLDKKFVNGELTLGENIGDLGGLTIAYKAYRMSLQGKEAPVIDGYTGDQRFFLGWAQVWRRKYRAAELERRLMTDSHSPSQYRVIGILSNMPEFYRAFDVKEGDGMHRPDDERVKIW
jgi:putative endopeptidase